jgi:hypothetical protein
MTRKALTTPATTNQQKSGRDAVIIASPSRTKNTQRSLDCKRFGRRPELRGSAGVPAESFRGENAMLVLTKLLLSVELDLALTP